MYMFITYPQQKRLYSAKETYNFKEPTNRSHAIPYTKAYVYVHYIYTTKDAGDIHTDHSMHTHNRNAFSIECLCVFNYCVFVL